MNELTDRLERLNEYKERTKHMRGMHDQRKHNRYPDGYVPESGSGTGGSGGSRAPKGDSGGVTGGGSGNSGGMAVAVPILERKPKVNALADQVESTTGVVSGRYQGARPERQAAFGLQAARVQRAGARRTEAKRQGEEYRRRHRMTNFTAPTQGIVSPLSMKAMAYGNFFKANDPNASLFEDPTRIVGNNPSASGQKTDMWSYMTAEIATVSSDVSQYLQNEVGMSASLAETYSQRISKALLKRYEAYMRKGAASYAMDIQGFVGGDIYSNDDAEMVAARAMAVEANKILAGAKNTIGAILDEAADKAGKPAFADDTVLNPILDKMDTAISRWSTANEPNAIAPATMPGLAVATAFPQDSSRAIPGTGEIGTVINPRQLSRANPALAEDVISRTIEESGGVNTPASMSRQSSSPWLAGTFGSDPNSVDNLTLSTNNMFALLSPEIQKQLVRMIKAPLKYPQSDNPATAFEDTQSAPLSANNATALTALKEMLAELHTDGGIADVQVAEHSLVSTTTRALFAVYELEDYGLKDNGKPAIILNTNAGSSITNSPEPRVGEQISSLAHEFGHLIDLSALSFGDANWRDFVSIMDSIGVSAGVSNPALMSKSPMVAPILRILDRFKNSVGQDLQSFYNGASEKSKPEVKRIVEYMSQPKEIFARLYQQWVVTEMMNRIDKGKSYGGVKDADGLQAELQASIGHQIGGMSRHFRGQDYEEAVKDLQELFAIMGWKIK